MASRSMAGLVIRRSWVRSPPAPLVFVSLTCGFPRALGLAELRVAQDLLDDADADALLKQQRGGGMAGVVDSGGSQTGFIEQRSPVFPVLAPVDRGAASATPSAWS
jgi:hypothetical protein